MINGTFCLIKCYPNPRGLSTFDYNKFALCSDNCTNLSIQYYNLSRPIQYRQFQPGNKLHLLILRCCESVIHKKRKSNRRGLKQLLATLATQKYSINQCFIAGRYCTMGREVRSLTKGQKEILIVTSYIIKHVVSSNL